MNLEMIEQRTGRKFERVETVKTNGVRYEGVKVLNSTSNIVPVLYQVDMTDEEFTDFVADKYASYEVPEHQLDFLNKDYILQNVFPALVNTELNTEKLTEWINRGFNDLSIIYKVDVDNGVYTLNESMLHYVGLTIDEVHEAAIHNIKPKITDMQDILERNGYPETPEMRGMMYVLSNKKFCYGAGSMLNDEILKTLYDIIGSFYILPSSVHEVICTPKFTSDVQTLKKMVQEVNCAEVSEMEKLSDNIYEYDGKVVSVIEVA